MVGGTGQRCLRHFIYGIISCALLLAGAGGALAASDSKRFSGSYVGVGRANEMLLVLQVEGSRAFGRIMDGRENVFELNGFVEADSISGSLHSPIGAARFEVISRPTGVLFTLVPVTPDGAPNVAAARPYTFTRGKVEVAAFDELQDLESSTHALSADLFAFVAAYDDRTDQNIADAYKVMALKDQAFINVFSHLQADIARRLCTVQAGPESLSHVLVGQTLECKDLLALFKKTGKKTNGLAQYNAGLDQELGALSAVLLCDGASGNKCTGAYETATMHALQWKSIDKLLQTTADKNKLRSVAWAKRQAARKAARMAEKAGPPAAQSKSKKKKTNLARLPVPRERPLRASDIADGLSIDEMVLAVSDQSMIIGEDKIKPVSLRGSFGAAVPSAEGVTAALPKGEGLSGAQLQRVVRRLRERPTQADAS